MINIRENLTNIKQWQCKEMATERCGRWCHTQIFLTLHSKEWRSTIWNDGTEYRDEAHSLKLQTSTRRSKVTELEKLRRRWIKKPTWASLAADPIWASWIRTESTGGQQHRTETFKNRSCLRHREWGSEVREKTDFSFVPLCTVWIVLHSCYVLILHCGSEK